MAKQESPKTTPQKKQSQYPQNAKDATQECIDMLKLIREEQPADSISVIILKRAIARIEVIRDNIC